MVGSSHSFLFRRDIRNPLGWKSHLKLEKNPPAPPEDTDNFFSSPHLNLKIIPSLTGRDAYLPDMLRWREKS